VRTRKGTRPPQAGTLAGVGEGGRVLGPDDPAAGTAHDQRARVRTSSRALPRKARNAESCDGIPLIVSSSLRFASLTRRTIRSSRSMGSLGTWPRDRLHEPSCLCGRSLARFEQAAADTGSTIVSASSRWEALPAYPAACSSTFCMLLISSLLRCNFRVLFDGFGPAAWKHLKGRPWRQARLPGPRRLPASQGARPRRPLGSPDLRRVPAPNHPFAVLPNRRLHQGAETKIGVSARQQG